jgi:magnesium chelatase family protein
MKIFTPFPLSPEPFLIPIEVASFFQVPHFQIIGLASQEINEARERIRSAVLNSGLQFPKRRVVINLPPADLKKSGSGFDLAMAIALLIHALELKDKKIQSSRVALNIAAWGELSLTGEIKSGGQLTRALYSAFLCSTSKEKIDCFVLPKEDHAQAIRILEILFPSKDKGMKAPTIMSFEELKDTWISLKKIRSGKLSADHFAGLHRNGDLQAPKKVSPQIFSSSHSQGLLPLSPFLERLIGVIASGHHHSLFLGSRGSGKTQSLEWLRAILPHPDQRELLQSKLLNELRFSQQKKNEPFSEHPLSIERSISPQVRPSALLGQVQGGRIIPGELSLANGGLLIADEFLEWHRDSREVLREPLEKKSLTLSRGGISATLPAHFIFMGTGNLCPCGGIHAHFLGSQSQKISKNQLCQCPDHVRRKYLQKLSGPILDRMDLCYLFTPLLIHPTACEKSRQRAPKKNACTSSIELLQKKVLQSRRVLKLKYGDLSGNLLAPELENLISKNPSWTEALDQYSDLSLRGRHKLLRVALTLSVWDEGEGPEQRHFMEAYLYRPEALFHRSP